MTQKDLAVIKPGNVGISLTLRAAPCPPPFRCRKEIATRSNLATTWEIAQSPLNCHASEISDG